MADALELELETPLPIDTIIKGDCIEEMKKLPSNSFDVAIIDPPYNLSSGGNWSWDNSEKLAGFGGNWSKVMENWDNMPLIEYFNFCSVWIGEVKRLVKPTGSFWIHGTYHNIGIINFILQLQNIEIINEVVWYKRNSFPNLSGRRLTASHETILWGHTGTAKKREYYFDYEKSKSLSFPEDNLKQAGKQMRTVWDVPNNKSKEELAYGKHPTQKPIRLIKRMLDISTKEGDTILVPFVGSGTDCVAAKMNGLHYVGFEVEDEYIKIASERLKHCNNDLTLFDSVSEGR